MHNGNLEVLESWLTSFQPSTTAHSSSNLIKQALILDRVVHLRVPNFSSLPKLEAILSVKKKIQDKLEDLNSVRFLWSISKMIMSLQI